MSNVGCLMTIFRLFMHVSTRYDRMSPEERAGTTYFGGYSIIMSILCSIFFVLSLWGILALVPMIETSGVGVFAIIAFIIILGLVALTLLGELVIGGLFGIIYQARCNNHPIKWIAAVVLIISVAAMIFGIIMVCNLTGVELF